MSASREKKRRQQLEGLSEKERMQADSNKKSKARRTLYFVLGAVTALLVAALLIWNTGFFQSRSTALTVAGEKYTVTDLSYYYYTALNSTISTARSYAQYGINMGYDPNVSPSKQMHDEERTWADYFREGAVQDMRQVALLCAEAEKAGFVLSDEVQAALDETDTQLAQYSAQYGYSKAAYLKLLYGPYMTRDVFFRQMFMSTLAAEYAAHFTDSFTYTGEDLEAYYSEHADDLDTFDFRFCYIGGTVESATDTDGGTAEPTEDERAAALAAAKAKADEMAERYRAGEEFNALAAEYADESTADSYSDPEHNHISDSVGSGLSGYPFADWLKESGRKAGDVGVVEYGSDGYYVVAFNLREHLNNSYQSVDVRHILVLAETDEDEAVPTESQLEAAYAKAQDLLSQWQSGEATSESFAKLADAHSDDPGSNTRGGLYENVERDQMIPSFNDWIFTPGRRAGDVGIVVNTAGGTDDVRGYHVVYLEQTGAVRWVYQAEKALSAADYSAWYEATEHDYPFEIKGALSLVK